MTRVSETPLEQTLRNLPSVGKLVKDRGYRQVWRFEHDGRAYFLKFYPRHGCRDAFRRLSRGSPARMEFERLQWLQKADIPAPRVVAALYGFHLSGRTGDAVILHAVEPSVQLDHYLNAYELQRRSRPAPPRLGRPGPIAGEAAGQGRARARGPAPGQLPSEGRQACICSTATRSARAGCGSATCCCSGHSVRRFATLTDIVRGWKELGPGGPLPGEQPGVAPALGRLSEAARRSKTVTSAACRSGEWSGSFFKHDKYPRRWSDASRLEIVEAEWQAAWPGLLADIEADRLPVIKRSPSGDVLRATVSLGGRERRRDRQAPAPPLLVSISQRDRPRLASLPRRGSRRGRWSCATCRPRGPCCSWRSARLGYVTDGVIVFERVPGTTLGRATWTSCRRAGARRSFMRAGRILRTIERLGFAHFDAKASNWIVRDDEQLRPRPDADRRGRHPPAPMDCAGHPPTAAQPARRTANTLPPIRWPCAAAMRRTPRCAGAGLRTNLSIAGRDVGGGIATMLKHLALPAEPRRILIIKPSAIGDIVHALPVLNLLRRRWPQAHVSWLVTPACADLLSGHPQIDRSFSLSASASAAPGATPRACGRCSLFSIRSAHRRFDLVIDLQGLFRSGWFVGADALPRCASASPTPAREAGFSTRTTSARHGSRTRSTATSTWPRPWGAAQPRRMGVPQTSGGRATSSQTLLRRWPLRRPRAGSQLGHQAVARLEDLRPSSRRCANGSAWPPWWPAARRCRPGGADARRDRSDRQDQSPPTRRSCWNGPRW